MFSLEAETQTKTAIFLEKYLFEQDQYLPIHIFE